MKKNELFENHIVNKNSSFELKYDYIDPRKLLSANRLDIGFKLFYLNNREYINEFSVKIYKSHIRAITDNSFKEFGNNTKSDFKKFLDEFLTIEASLLKNEFDTDASIIPVSENNVLLDGSHRLSIAVKNKIQIAIQKFDLKHPAYNWKFFRDRGVAKNHIEIAVNQMVQYSNNIYTAFIWPKAKNNTQSFLESISEDKLLYIKKVKLGTNGGMNLLTQLYKDQEWLGGIEQGYNGAISKLSQTFDSSGILHVVFFFEENQSKVMSIKKMFRDKIGIGKHSIHINDNKDETLLISQLILNRNSIAFLNDSKILRFKENINLISSYKSLIDKKNLDIQNFVICGSMPLSLYGLTKAGDIDFLTIENIEFLEPGLNSHNGYLKHYNQSLNELIFNPENFFYFHGIKFLTIDNIIIFKKNRGELKDKLFLENYKANKSYYKVYLLGFLSTLSLYRFKALALIIKYSKILGVYNFLKFFYKRIIR